MTDSDDLPNFQKIFQRLPGRHLILSRDLKIVDVSESYLLGIFIPRNEIIGRYLFDVFPDNPQNNSENSLSGLKESLARVFQSKSSDQVNPLRYDLPDPENPNLFQERWWSATNTPILDAKGEVGFIIHSVEDHTADVMLKRMEVLTAQHERRELFGLFTQAPAAIAIVKGPSHTYELANEPYLKMVGRTEQQLVGRALKTAFPEVNPELVEILDGVYHTGKGYVATEYPISLNWRGSGQIEERFLNFVYAPYLDTSGSVIGVLVFAFDVSEQVEAKKSAFASEKQLRLITDSLPALISYMDKHGKYQFVNQAYSKWFGLPREAIEGKTRKDLIANNETYGEMQLHEKQAFAGKPASFELTLSKPTGEFMNLDTEFLPDLDPETGEVRGIVGVGHDVTQRKKALEEALQARTEVEKLASELKEAVSSRDEFMSIASHELKTPITSLKLQLQMTKRRLEMGVPLVSSPEKISHVLDVSMRQVERLTDLVESLLDVARIRGGRIEYGFTEFNFSPLINDVLENLSEQLEAAKCTVTVQAAPDLLVNWDRARVEQVLVNLMSNAMKYAPGTRIELCAQKVGERVQFSVEDLGPGIAKERQGKIFERFERATASRNISGLGLGLFIVNQIVKGHHGSVRVESEPGHGAKFFVDMPIDSSSG